MSTRQGATWVRHAGDQLDTIEIELSKALGETLSGVSSVEAVVRNRVSGDEEALVAAVSDSTNRIVTVQLDAWLASTVSAGEDYYVSLTVTTTSGSVVTFPEKLSQRPLLAIV